MKTCVLVYLVIYLSGSCAYGSRQDEYLTVPELIEKNGYLSETHSVVTEDGYILALHRIPAGTNKPVVLMLHGLLGSSHNWVALGPRNSLGFLLADDGYDVWLANVRGNHYSRNHTVLKRTDPKYWDFSWHEMGVYDVPAMTDYILNKTGQEALYNIGLSMGTTVQYVFASMRPEYNSKTRLFVSLAPFAFTKCVTSPFVRLSSLSKQVLHLMSVFGINNFLPKDRGTTFLSQICKNRVLQEICATMLFLGSGYDHKQLNASILPALLLHYPAGTSVKTMEHYTQLFTSPEGKFLQWDYGKRNMAVYKQPTPPEYNLTAITAPVVLFYGDNDPFADPTDVHKLNEVLPNSVGEYRVPLKEFTHGDFVFATDVKTLVYDQVLKIMKQF